MHRDGPLVLAVVIASLTLTAVAPGSSFISELVPSSSDDADIGATGGSPSTPETDSDLRGSPTESTEATASWARIASASRQPLSDARSLPPANGGSVPLRADSPEVRSGSHTSLPVASPSASSSPSTLVSESLALRDGRQLSPATGPSSASASPPPSQPTAVSPPRSAPPSMSPPPARRDPSATTSDSIADERITEVSSTAPATARPGSRSPRTARSTDPGSFSRVVPSPTPASERPLGHCPANTTADSEG